MKGTQSETSRLTIAQKNKVIALLKEYKIEGDRLIHNLIRELNISLAFIDMIFDPLNFEEDKKSIERDNNRINRILTIVSEFENPGLKADFFSTISPSFKYRFTLPKKNQDRQHIIKKCNPIAGILVELGYFKKSKERTLYPFLSSLVNILRPRSFSVDELNDGEIKAFKKYLNI